MKIVFAMLFFGGLVLTTSCLSFWPWMYTVQDRSEEEEEVLPKVKSLPLPGSSFVRRAITQRDKGFDYNQDGYISGEEIKFYRQAEKVRKAEEILTGRK